MKGEKKNETYAERQAESLTKKNPNAYSDSIPSNKRAHNTTKLTGNDCLQEQSYRPVEKRMKMEEIVVF
jgi:hypothetical protein